MKLCSKCRETKPFELFPKDKRRSDGLSSWCRVCASNASKAWTKKRRAEDPEYAKALSKHSANYHLKRRTEDPEYAKVLSKRSADCHQRRQAADPAYAAIRRELILQWKKNNPDKLNALNAKHRAAELRAMPLWYPDEHEAICALYRKARHLTKETGIPHHVDHIVPLQGKNVSGLHTLANLQILTAQENLRKNNKHYA